MIDFVCGELSISLPNPYIGDSLQINYDTIIRRSVGQTLIVNRPTNRLKLVNHVLTFDILDTTTYNDLITFLKNTAGQEVIYTDWNGDEHTVLILTPFNKLTHTARCFYNCSLELEEL